jgi:2',5'-phosphodiesterase
MATAAATSFVLASLVSIVRPRAVFSAWRPPTPFALRPPAGGAHPLSPAARASGAAASRGAGAASGAGGARPPNPPSDGAGAPSPSDLYAASPELDELLLRPGDAPALAHIVSYNVLSSALAAPSHFPACDPGDLDAHTRLSRLLTKLEEPVASRAIICLQEVSLPWAGPLHAFFASRHFHLVLASYGSYFNGFMGVAIAFPINTYDVLDVKVERLADAHAWPPRAPALTGVVRALVDLRTRATGVWRALFGDLDTRASPRRPRRSGRALITEVWNDARDRRNMLVFARLRSKANGARVCVGTYHMPCAFYSPPQMQIHSALVVSRFQDICASDPGVLAGDFNIKPHDSSYKMITTGKMDPGHRDFPKRASVPDGSPPEQWMPKLRHPMKSAYKEVLGDEPDFTNYAQTETGPPFIETLDYIFCTEDVDVVDVVRLPHRKAVAKGPYPTPTEPSDHCLIGCTLRLPAASAPARKRR